MSLSPYLPYKCYFLLSRIFEDLGNFFIFSTLFRWIGHLLGLKIYREKKKPKFSIGYAITEKLHVKNDQSRESIMLLCDFC